MILFQQITAKLQNKDQSTLIAEMGYHNKAIGLKTLSQFLEAKSIYLWLKKGRFDLYHTSKSFLLALSETLDVDREDCTKAIVYAEKREERIKQMHNPYIFIDTHFTRTTQPIIALAVMESHRRISINKEKIFLKCDDEVLETISKDIKTHYKKNHGVLPLWGKIYHYVYHHTDGKKYLFDSTGTLCDDKNINESKAEIRV